LISRRLVCSGKDVSRCNLRRVGRYGTNLSAIGAASGNGTAVELDVEIEGDEALQLDREQLMVAGIPRGFLRTPRR
jgi:hypothetical protein